MIMQLEICGQEYSATLSFKYPSTIQH